MTDVPVRRRLCKRRGQILLHRLPPHGSEPGREIHRLREHVGHDGDALAGTPSLSWLRADLDPLSRPTMPGLGGSPSGIARRFRSIRIISAGDDSDSVLEPRSMYVPASVMLSDRP